MPPFCPFTPADHSLFLVRSSPRDSAFGGRRSVSAFLAPRWFLVPSSSLVSERQRWWGRRECADERIREGFVRSVLTVFGDWTKHIPISPLRPARSCQRDCILSLLSSPFARPRLGLVTRRFQDEDDRYSQLARGQLPVADRTERPERGNSVKREWCAAGRRTIRHLRCTRGRHHARDGIAAAGRCSYHLVAEPYHPPGRYPSTLARSSATHPAGVITPTLLALPLSLALLSHQLFLLRLLPFPTFHLSCSMLFLFPATRPRVLSLRVSKVYSRSFLHVYNDDLKTYRHCSRKH